MPGLSRSGVQPAAAAAPSLARQPGAAPCARRPRPPARRGGDDRLVRDEQDGEPVVASSDAR